MPPIEAGESGNAGCSRAVAFAVNGQTIAPIEALSEVIVHDGSAKFGAAAGDFASVVDFFDLRVLT
jgi:hypothetical protein